MSEAKDFNEKESLELITSMIAAAKGNIGYNVIFFLLWGWVVLGASLVHYYLIQIEYENPWLPWPILMPITGLASAIIGAKMKKQQRDVGFVLSAIKYVWIGFGVTLFVVIINGYKMGWGNAYSILISLYAIATFITGGLIKFKPLMYGAISAWIISIITFYLPFEYVVLMLGLSMITAYLIPAYMLKRASVKSL